MTEGWRLDDQAVRALEAAVNGGNLEIVALVKRAVALAGEIGPDSTDPYGAERRLGDRILGALDLALDQENLAVAEHLELAFEAAMTSFGGPGAVEQRDIPEAMSRIYVRLDELRRQRHRG